MLGTTVHNVVRLEQDSVFYHIQTYLRNREIKSKNTQIAYENDIRQFFKFMKNKSIEDLTPEDLIFNNSDMEAYQNYLYHDYVQPNGKKYSNITINRKMNTIVALYRSLKKKGFNVDPEIMKVDDLPDDSKQIGILMVDEIDTMLAISDDELLNAFIMFALRTGLRKKAILNLEWNQIQPDINKPDFYVIRLIDKGKPIEREIHQSMYDILLKIKKDDAKVFPIPRSTLDYRFRALCKKAGIDEKRKISIHSLKKAGVTYVKEYTGDLHIAQAQGGHASPSTTAKYYLERPRNLAATILDVKIDDNIFDELTREELIKLVNSFGNGVKQKLKMKAKEIIESRSLDLDD